MSWKKKIIILNVIKSLNREKEGLNKEIKANRAVVAESVRASINHDVFNFCCWLKGRGLKPNFAVLRIDFMKVGKSSKNDSTRLQMFVAA